MIFLSFIIVDKRKQKKAFTENSYADNIPPAYRCKTQFHIYRRGDGAIVYKLMPLARPSFAVETCVSHACELCSPDQWGYEQGLYTSITTQRPHMIFTTRCRHNAKQYRRGGGGGGGIQAKKALMNFIIHRMVLVVGPPSIRNTSIVCLLFGFEASERGHCADNLSGKLLRARPHCHTPPCSSYCFSFMAQK